jgi:hypothetical protein
MNHIRKLNIPDKKKIEILDRMTKAFTHRKGVDDPYAYALLLLNRALNGTDKNGNIWRKAPGSESDDDITVLKKRLRILGFDLDNSIAIESATKRLTKSDKLVKQLVPKEKDEEDIPKTIKYGTAVGSILTDEEKRLYEKTKREILKEFPQLNTPADLPFVDRYAYLVVMSRREALERLLSEKARLDNNSETLTKQMREITDTLGITAKQRMSKRDMDSKDTIEALSLRYEQTKKEFAEVEAKWLLEECHLILKAYEEGRITETIMKFMLSTIRRDYNTPDVKRLLISNGIIEDKEALPQEV